MIGLSARATDLSDLATDKPLLPIDPEGTPSGIRLLSHIASGGMASVLLGEVDRSALSPRLSPLTPEHVAVKVLMPRAVTQLARHGVEANALIVKESVSLERVMKHRPPTEFVVQLYGNGEALVQLSGRRWFLPWLAMEHVDGGAAGSNLTARVLAAVGGVDPVRARKLITGIMEGVGVLHSEGIIHRDLKPDNVLMVGPVDDETPKIADCGIARITGVATIAVNAATMSYGAPEQLASVPGEANMLIGPWTDVHALAAVIWYILGGDEWCQGGASWHLRGERRPLSSSGRLHQGFALDRQLLARLDEVLAKGAAARPPESSCFGSATGVTAEIFKQSVARFPAVERYADVASFAQDLLPLLIETEAKWKAHAARRGQAATVLRPTCWVSADETTATQLARVTLHEPLRGAQQLTPAQPHNVVFRADGSVLVRFGERLVYIVNGTPHRVAVPGSLKELVARTRWVVRGPRGGFGLVGPSHLILIRGGKFEPASLPSRPDGEVGAVTAVVGAVGLLGVVTEGTDDSDDFPEYWRSADGSRWSEPCQLPIHGAIRDLSVGPFGCIAAGSSRNGKKARAVAIGHTDQALPLPWVTKYPGLQAVIASAGREAWAAGGGKIIGLEADGASEEPAPAHADAVTLALDPVNQPWLVTRHEVLRRHCEGTASSWQTYYQRSPAEPPLVGIGFTSGGARVLDAAGAMVEIEPLDAYEWKVATVSTMG